MLTLHGHHDDDVEDSTLEYASHHAHARRRARVRRATRIIFALAVITLALAVGWRLSKQARYLYLQSQAMRFAQPEGAVVLDGKAPVVSPGIARVLPDHSNAAFAFLHERTSVGGTRRLVAVRVNRDGERLWFTSTSYVPATMQAKSVMTIDASRGRALELKGARSSSVLRVLAGQVDPKDGSHFTIEVWFAGKLQVLDGWLGDDGAVSLEDRRTPGAGW